MDESKDNQCYYKPAKMVQNKILSIIIHAFTKLNKVFKCLQSARFISIDQKGQ